MISGVARRLLGAAVSGDQTATIASVGKGVLTYGQVRAAYAAGPDLMTALGHVLAGKATMDDAQVIERDAFAGLVLAVPEAAAFEGLAEVALQLAPIIAAGYQEGRIRGDPDPIHNAQTQPSRPPPGPRPWDRPLFP